jgi:hypothetical protein
MHIGIGIFVMWLVGLTVLHLLKKLLTGQW